MCNYCAKHIEGVRDAREHDTFVADEYGFWGKRKKIIPKKPLELEPGRVDPTEFPALAAALVAAKNGSLNGGEE